MRFSKKHQSFLLADVFKADFKQTFDFFRLGDHLHREFIARAIQDVGKTLQNKAPKNWDIEREQEITTFALHNNFSGLFGENVEENQEGETRIARRSRVM